MARLVGLRNSGESRILGLRILLVPLFGLGYFDFSLVPFKYV